ncbi:MAG: radical SAM family heme chaperone HemW [Eubacterium sp.]|nr:radical SAM family heme chaperone HemW [Eubacterium sp.]
MIGLYIHVPFCKRKCHYCDFPSWAGREDQIAAYFDRLLTEISAFARAWGPRSVDTVYFGGGTPSLVGAEYIARVMETIHRHFTLADPECTLELNPASVDLDKIKTYRAWGINRVSVGLQASQDALLKTLGRLHSWGDFVKTMAALDKAGIDNISADLMLGLPGQTVAMLLDSARALADFAGLRHISCYSLKVEEGTVFYKRQLQGTLDLPDEKTERAMQHAVIKALEALGYKQYEISNFARPGFESRHNSRYWDLSEYVGFGLGAASYFGGRRFTNTFDLKTYISTSPDQPVVRAEDHLLDAAEARGDFMFLGLRRMAGVAEAEYKRLFNRSFFEDYGPEIADLEARGLIKRTAAGIALTDLGQDLANQVFMAFV